MTTTRDIPEGERLTRLEAVVEALVREAADVNAELRELRSDMLTQLARLEARVDSRFAGVESRLEGLSSRLEGLNSRLEGLSSKIDRNFLWTLGIMLGIMIPMWISIIVALLLRT